MDQVFDSEQQTILIIILVTAILGSIFYGFSVHMAAQHRRQVVALLNSLTPAPQPTSTPPKSQPPALSEEEQIEARRKHIDLVQASLQTKLQDVETYFATRDLFESAQTRAQLRKQRQEEAYMDYMMRAHLRSQTPTVLITPPAPNTAHAPAQQITTERVPFLPVPGSYNPLAELRPPPCSRALTARMQSLREDRPRIAQAQSVTAYDFEYDFDPQFDPRIREWLRNLPARPSTRTERERSEWVNNF